MIDVRKAKRIEFTAEDLRRRATGLLLPVDGATRALHLQTAEIASPAARAAAVLVPVIDRKPEATLLITLRTERLAVHAGQIAFPGGKVEETDLTPAETALREAEEEIGLARSFVDLVGFLDCYRTNKGFCIAPAIGVVRPDFGLKLDPREVAETFEVPFRFFMSPENHEFHKREIDGERRDYYAMPYQGRHIWGVTAGIIRALYERLYLMPGLTSPRNYP
ncbi:MAG: CoA pyrophosphatase [Alphaproteobacteria bacterium]|nr:CoA pyrophosphatase [Alphaproteobacteria bacterium]